jgi:hypothetical protein
MAKRPSKTGLATKPKPKPKPKPKAAQSKTRLFDRLSATLFVHPWNRLEPRLEHINDGGDDAFGLFL